jgi:oligopeptidase B
VTDSTTSQTPDPTSTPSPPPEPPRAPRIPVERTHHGDTVVDDFEWLRDKDSDQTRQYLEQENAYTKAMTAPLEGLRTAIFDEIKAHTQETDMSVPSRTGGWWYYQRTIEGQQYPVVCRTKAGADWTPPVLEPGVDMPGEEILVDCNALAEGHEFFRLGAFSVTPDERLLAYSTDVVGDERYTIVVRDLTAGELLPDRIEGTLGGATWSADGSHLFYSTVDESWRPDKVWRHAIGSDSADVVVHHEPDDRFWTYITRTTSDRFLVIESHSKITTEAAILDATDPTGVFEVVVPRESGVEYSVEHAVIGSDDVLLVLHNKDALNFTLGMGPVGLHSLAELTTVIEPTDEVRLADVHASAGAVVVNLRQDGLPQVRVFPISEDGLGDGSNLEFEEPMYDVGATGFSDWEQPLVRLAYQSWLTPPTVYELDPATGERQLRKQQPVLGGYDPADYVQVREWAHAQDGTRVPVSILHRADVAPRSNAPTLLYGYGSYEISTDPMMRILWLSLLDRGMVVAVAHIRGGGEMGRQWYEQGKQLQKKNTFTDFVDVARHLIDRGWTSPARLVANGGSAGGLLMGAVANLAPELFAGIVAHVPFVDALTTILDPSLPLTVIEWDEWGDPLHDSDAYRYVKSYSPYENIAARPYPAIYAITSINDTRVLYVEPAKWVAKLRAVANSPNPVLLKCEMSAGHGGASGRYDAWREQADYLAWIVDTAGAEHHILGKAT